MQEFELLQQILQKLNDENIMNECLTYEQSEQSYYKENAGTYLEKLDMTTPILFEKKLKEIWGDAVENEDVQRLIKIVTVLAFKMKESDWVSDVVKDRIYNF